MYTVFRDYDNFLKFPPSNGIWWNNCDRCSIILHTVWMIHWFFTENSVFLVTHLQLTSVFAHCIHKHKCTQKYICLFKIDLLSRLLGSSEFSILRMFYWKCMWFLGFLNKYMKGLKDLYCPCLAKYVISRKDVIYLGTVLKLKYFKHLLSWSLHIWTSSIRSKLASQVTQRFVILLLK